MGILLANLGELLVGGVYTGFVFWLGTKLGRRLERRS